MKRLFTKIKCYVPVPSMVFLAIGLIACTINIAYVSSPAFADVFNEGISAYSRAAFAYLTSLIPFSLAEFILLSLPVTVSCVAVITVRKAARGNHEFVETTVVGLLSFLVLLYSVFVFNFGAGYHGSRLDKKIGIERADVSAEELYDTFLLVIDEVNKASADVTYIENLGSLRPFSHEYTVKKCIESYDILAEQYGFIKNIKVPVKRLAVSDVMTYTHIAGVYSFFTGEANLNTNYPYYVNVHTTAHEMAHQRGIAREDEANFIAYLVCINSDEPYIRYAGYLSMYDYLESAMYQASPELYYEAAAKLEEGPRYDLRCFTEFFQKYRDNPASDVSDAVNDAYLKFHGTEGTRSYGMVVDLAVAYYKNAKNS